jgi:hypothetical protein
MAETKIIREITMVTRRWLDIDDIEQALRDQYDLHVQDDIKFEWETGGLDHVRGVEIVHTTRETKEG